MLMTSGFLEPYRSIPNKKKRTDFNKIYVSKVRKNKCNLCEIPHIFGIGNKSNKEPMSTKYTFQK